MLTHSINITLVHEMMCLCTNIVHAVTLDCLKCSKSIEG